MGNFIAKPLDFEFSEEFLKNLKLGNDFLIYPIN